MEKFITIDGKPVGFRTNALTPRLYRERFGRDFIRDIGSMQRKFNQMADGENALEAIDLECFEDFAWTLAYQYAKHHAGEDGVTVYEDPDEWLEQFETFAIYELLPELFALWKDNEKTTSIPKNQ